MLLPGHGSDGEADLGRTVGRYAPKRPRQACAAADNRADFRAFPPATITLAISSRVVATK